MDGITLRALDIAKTRRGWNQAQFAEAIGADKQHVTNWKKRGFPPARYAKTAEVLGISVEELLTGKPDPKSGQDALAASRIEEASIAAYHIKVSREAMLFAAEWEKLPKALQSQFSALVHMTVAELARQNTHHTDAGPKTPPKGSKASSRRPHRADA